MIKSAQAEYRKLERKLRHALAQVEVRERKLSIAETEAERAAKMGMEDLQVLQRRIRTESKHSITMAEQKASNLELRVKELEDQLHKAHGQSRKVENEYAEYRVQQRRTPESALRDEIALLRGKIGELVRGVVFSFEFYK